jgi:isopentenyl phosphate kinase
MKKLFFLKLGGSLITNKDQESTVRMDRLISIGEQICRALKTDPEITLLIGHGSGSFGHHAAKKFGTRDGFAKPEEANRYWQGYFSVYQQAHALNRLVMDAMHKTGNPCIEFAPNTMIKTKDHLITQWSVGSIKASIQARLIPVIFGDVVFDDVIGGTILSTEDLFGFLASSLKPQKIYLAGIEDGVWEDYPANKTLIAKINTNNFDQYRKAILGSGSIDVTGGMDSKVRQMLSLTKQVEGLSIRVFSGIPEDNIYKALTGSEIGTLIE